MLRRRRRRSSRTFGSVLPAVAEQMFEHHARIVLRRQGCIGASPRDRVGVGTRKTGVAGARHVAGLDSQLERCQLRVLACLLREDLVHRNAGVEQRFARRRRHVGQEPCRRFGMCSARPAGHRHAVEIAEHEQLVSKWRQRRHRRHELEGGALGGGQPVLHDHAVGHVHRAETIDRLGRGLHHGGQSRDHSVEQRQCDRDPKAAQHRATGYLLFRDNHRPGLLISWRSSCEPACSGRYPPRAQPSPS